MIEVCAQHSICRVGRGQFVGVCKAQHVCVGG